MSEFEVILEANSLPPRTKRKPVLSDKESLFLDKVREVKLNLIKGLKTIVVVGSEKSFEQVFLNYTTAMKIYARKGDLQIKTLDEVTEEDLECCFVEMES